MFRKTIGDVVRLAALVAGILLGTTTVSLAAGVLTLSDAKLICVDGTATQTILKGKTALQGTCSVILGKARGVTIIPDGKLSPADVDKISEVVIDLINRSPHVKVVTPNDLGKICPARSFADDTEFCRLNFLLEEGVHVISAGLLTQAVKDAITQKVADEIDRLGRPTR